ncbi:MAG: tetratricopeptide repeat protein [Deltaproteobacteria bacterium]|nr:tetratricopeptide repeat protein [Deltaproteobacteria bacterium]
MFVNTRCLPVLVSVLLLLQLAVSSCVSKAENPANSGISHTQENASANLSLVAKSLLAEIEQQMKNKQFKAALDKVEILINQDKQIPRSHLLKARILEGLGQKQQALNYLTQQIKENPENIGLIVARGQFLLDTGYVESARSDFLQAYKKNYRSFEILKLLSVIERTNGNLKESLNLTTEALNLNSNDHELWFIKAQLELRLHKLQEAKQSSVTAIKLFDANLKYYQLFIEILGFLKDRPEMERTIRMLVQKFPDDAWVNMRYATLLYANNEQKKAKAVLTRAVELHPRDYLLTFQLATILATEKKWEQSIQLFLSGLEVKPDSTWAKVQLSKVYFQAGQSLMAVEYLKKARAEASRDPFVYETLAKIYNRQNDTFEAERIILEGLAINRKNQNLILEYAGILEKRANYKEAIKAFEKALANNPDNYVVLGKLGNLHRLLKNYDKSKQYFQRSIQLKSDTSWVRSFYVELLSDMEDWREALQEIDLILEITANDYWTYAKKAQIEHQLGNFEAAHQSIKKAIALRPDAPWLKEIEAKSLESLGKYALAEESFQIALKTSVDNAYLLTRLGYVQLHLDRKAALRSVEKALDSEDFDISTIELYMYLKGQSYLSWGFKENSPEAKAHDAIMHKQFTVAKTLLQKPGMKNSPHLPFLRSLTQLLARESRSVLSSNVTLSPDLSDWHFFYLGMDALGKRDLQTAKHHFQKGLLSNPQNIWLMIKLAYVHQQLKEYKPAIDLLEKYLMRRSEGRNTWVKLKLALNLDLSFQVIKAEKVYMDILEDDPDDNVALNNLAWMYLTTKNSEMHKLDEALKLSLKAVKLSPSPANLDTLAEAYYQKKEFHKALKTVERALDRDRQGLDDFKKTKKKILKAIQSTKK